MLFNLKLNIYLLKVVLSNHEINLSQHSILVSDLS
jgi:hypothetical protein